MTPSHRPPDHPNWDRNPEPLRPTTTATVILAVAFAAGIAVGVAAARWRR